MDIKKYMKHLPACNIMQDWSEAESAYADTPSQFRDESWNQSRAELDVKRSTCTCGLKEAIKAMENSTELEEYFQKTFPLHEFYPGRYCVYTSQENIREYAKLFYASVNFYP